MITQLRTNQKSNWPLHWREILGTIYSAADKIEIQITFDFLHTDWPLVGDQRTHKPNDIGYDPLCRVVIHNLKLHLISALRVISLTFDFPRGDMFRFESLPSCPFLRLRSIPSTTRTWSRSSRWRRHSPTRPQPELDRSSGHQPLAFGKIGSVMCTCNFQRIWKGK